MLSNKGGGYLKIVKAGEPKLVLCFCYDIDAGGAVLGGLHFFDYRGLIERDDNVDLLLIAFEAGKVLGDLKIPWDNAICNFTFLGIVVIVFVELNDQTTLFI